MENKKETKLNLKQLEKITGGFYRVIFSDGGYTIALRPTENETITSKFSFKELIEQSNNGLYPVIKGKTGEVEFHRIEELVTILPTLEEQSVLFDEVDNNNINLLQQITKSL